MAKKILIIDDDRDMVDSLTMVLTGNGYEVDSITTATGALEKARAVKPDLIVLDVMFPENPSEGFDLARQLHDGEATAKIPILMLSAINARFKLGFSERHQDETWLPVAHFIEKPIEPAKLIAMVREAIGS